MPFCTASPGRRRAVPPIYTALTDPNLSMPQQINGIQLPAIEEIALCAYLIWDREGRPSGREKEHWFQAETQLLATRAHDEWTGNRQPSHSLS